MKLMDELYQEIILEHYKKPKNQVLVSNADIVLKGVNPFCGDEIEITIKLDGDRIEQVGFDGSGCVISQASSSLMTENIKGKSIDEVHSLISEFTKLVKGEDIQLDLEELCAFRGVAEFPTRIKCALLPWKTLEEGIDEVLKQRGAKQEQNSPHSASVQNE
jgi:nitrogen fixation NifU-like protein